MMIVGAIREIFCSGTVFHVVLMPCNTTGCKSRFFWSDTEILRSGYYNELDGDIIPPFGEEDSCDMLYSFCVYPIYLYRFLPPSIQMQLIVSPVSYPPTNIKRFEYVRYAQRKFGVQVLYTVRFYVNFCRYILVLGCFNIAT